MQLPPPPPNTEPQEAWRSRSPKYRFLFAGAGVLVLSAMLGSATLVSPLLSTEITRKCLSNDCTGKASGPSAPWPTIVAKAKEQISKIDNTAVLEGISAFPLVLYSNDWNYDKTLFVDFRYINPSGKQITLRLQDTDPDVIREVDYSSDPAHHLYNSAVSMQEEYNRNLALVKIGPRDAGTRTWQDALSHSNDVGGISPLLLLDLRESL